MLRKTLIIASLLITSTCFAGFYLGAGGGPEGASFTQKSHVTRFNTFNVRDKEHFAGTGGFATILGGYGWMNKQFALAGEINANVSSVEYTLSNKEFIHQTFSNTWFTIKRSFGISILPGFLISENTVIYGRIGYANGRLKIAESDPTIQSMTKNRSGLRYGIGIRHEFKPRWVFMMDYSQINYNSVTSHVYEPFGEVTKETRITPHTAQVAFGLIYCFDAPEKVYVK